MLGYFHQQGHQPYLSMKKVSQGWDPVDSEEKKRQIVPFDYQQRPGGDLLLPNLVLLCQMSHALMSHGWQTSLVPTQPTRQCNSARANITDPKHHSTTTLFVSHSLTHLALFGAVHRVHSHINTSRGINIYTTEFPFY